MEKLEKYITDERTGLKYELIGDHYIIAGDDEPEEQKQIGVWGQRRLRYIRQHKNLLYAESLLSGKLNGHLVDINEQAETMFNLLLKQMAACGDISEKLKAENQMKWVDVMNNIRNRAKEIVMYDFIYQV